LEAPESWPSRWWPGLPGDLFALGAWRPLESEGGRGTLIGAAVAAWIAWELWRARRARLQNAQLLEVLAAGDGSDSATRAAHEIAVLRARFEEAAAVLKSARFKGPDGERRYVHELPWYVFIGAPGSGKTTALVNSGLQFPLKAAGGDPALAGVGGTRNCDWWFTDDAVLLDTAGRYTTQESDLEADAAAWLGFLDLVKRFRPQRPLNGALVTLSVSDLMLWTEEERKRYAWHVRARVAELYDRLGVRFPVYLLVTKADLLAGLSRCSAIWMRTVGRAFGGPRLNTRPMALCWAVRASDSRRNSVSWKPGSMARCSSGCRRKRICKGALRPTGFPNSFAAWGR
jgi:type VI secretion system protein ImpL